MLIRKLYLEKKYKTQKIKSKTFKKMKKSLLKYIEGWDKNHRIKKN